MSEALKELIKYIQLGSRLDLKDYALSQILGLTGTPEGLQLVRNEDEVLLSLLILLSDTNETVSKDSSLILVNLSADAEGASKLVNLDIKRLHQPSKLITPPSPLPQILISSILDADCHFADPACMVLSNISRISHLVESIVDCIDTKQWDRLMNAFTTIKYNKKGAHLNYLGPVFSNLSQSVTVRKIIMDRDNSFVQRLIAFTEYEESVTRRGGVIGTLKNCCFDPGQHEWLLSDKVDILPKLLLPLAGGEEFDDEDNDKLPADLQYLPEDKRREPDPDIRCMLLEALTQLCAKRVNREYMRDKNVYVILRELHKSEKDAKALLACENLVDILIRTEDEINEDDLKSLDVPEDVIEKLEKLNDAS